jgi:hypothetical protein
MTLCCTAKRPSRRRFTISASARDTGAPVSIDFGTKRLPVNAIA